MEEQRPLVSIIVRTKDRPKLLRNALKSIANQTYRPIEVVLVNDGGCDLDVEEIRSLLGDVFLNYIRLEENTGRAHAGNVGIDNANGEYIGFLDDDDEFYPTHILDLMNLLWQQGSVVVYSDAHILTCKIHSVNEDRPSGEKKIFSSMDFSMSDLLCDNFIPLSCIIFYHKIFKDVGGFDERFDIYEDWDLLIRVAEKYHFHHLKKPTVLYIQWSDTDQVAQASRFAEKAKLAHKQIINKHKEKFTEDFIYDISGLIRRARSGNTKGIVSLHLYKEIEKMNREIDEMNGRISFLEKELGEKDLMVSSLEGELSRKNSILHEKERLLDSIYTSEGWKALLIYYRLRDRVFPLGSKRRLIAKSLFKMFARPVDGLRNLNITNIRKFVHYFRNADPLILESKIERKFARRGDFNNFPTVEGLELTGLDGEPDEVIIIDDSRSGVSDTSFFQKRDVVIKRFEELKYKIIPSPEDIEGYLRNKGQDIAYVLGVDPLRCMEQFPLITTYAINSKIIYWPIKREGATIVTDLFNASIADITVVDTGEYRDILLKHDPSLKIFIFNNTFDFSKVIENTPAEKWFEVEETENSEGEGGLLRRGCSTSLPDHLDSNTVSRERVLIAGIYLASQKNNIECIIDELGQSKNYTVTQKWMAIGSIDSISDMVKKATVSNVDEPIPKFVLINKLLSYEDIDRYEYIIICDDDILLPEGFLDKFLNLQKRYDFALAQPARSHDSYIDHYFVEQLDGLVARWTRYVEIGPVFSIHKNLYPHILPFDETSPMGWGYDFVWPCIIERLGLRMGVIDALPVVHNLRRPMHNYRYDDAKKAMERYLSVHVHLSREEAFSIIESYA